MYKRMHFKHHTFHVHLAVLHSDLSEPHVLSTGRRQLALNMMFFTFYQKLFRYMLSRLQVRLHGMHADDVQVLGNWL